MQNYSVESDESCSVDSDESCSEESADTPVHDAPNYEAGDLVWAKVKSHPWWPGQIFNVFYASEEARCLEKPGKILVAFYGDHTFAWLDHSQILEFKPSFQKKAKATDVQLFQDALSEALDEVCWRAQLGLECRCCRSKRDNDADIGVQEGTLWLHKDVSRSKETLDARRTLSFLKDLATSPCNPASISTVNASVLCGHILGIRIGIAADKGIHGPLEDWHFAASTNKRPRVGGLEVDNEEKARASRQRTCSKNGVYGLIGSSDEASSRQGNTLPELSGERICFFREMLEQNRGSTTSFSEPSACWHNKATQSLMQISEDLHYAAVNPLCYHGGSYNTTVTKMAAIFKFRDLVFQKSARYAGYHLEIQEQELMKMRDEPPHAGICAGGNDSSNPLPKAARYWRPIILKQRSMCPKMNRLENLEALKSPIAQPYTQHAASRKTCHEGKELSFDREGMVSGTSFEGVSRAHSQAWERVFSRKLDVQDLLIKAHRKTSDFTKEAPAELGMHEQYLMEAQKRKSSVTKEAPSKLDVHELLVEARKKKVYDLVH